MSRDPAGRRLRLELEMDTDADRATLRGALLAAQAGELSEIRRRTGRLSFGYGSDSARESMDSEVDQHSRRWDMLDRLIKALDDAETVR